MKTRDSVYVSIMHYIHGRHLLIISGIKNESGTDMRLSERDMENIGKQRGKRSEDLPVNGKTHDHRYRIAGSYDCRR